jgi:TM2 domain-containing membrane protein YozV
MEPSIPIPTDNVYKFHALFGLVFFISLMLASVYVHNYYNKRIYNAYLELETLKAKNNLTSEENIKKSLLEGRMREDKADFKFFFSIVLFFGIFVGFVMMIIGFVGWHIKVQPLQDKLLDLQIKKIEREITVLDKQLQRTQLEPQPSLPPIEN